MQEIIKCPFNYNGSKTRLLPQLAEHIHWKSEYICEPFSGTLSLTINYGDKFKKCYASDINWQLIRTLQYFKATPIQAILSEIDKTIGFFKLSKTNKDGFNSLRSYYNTFCKDKNNFNPTMFYCLATHSFNHQVEFSIKEEFNVPNGFNRSWFNPTLREKLIKYVEKLQSISINFTEYRFSNTMDCSVTSPHESFYFVDPPYFASSASCYRIAGKRWNEDNEREMYLRLDRINELDGKFLLTNVLTKGTNTNLILAGWMKKYNVVELDNSYKNSNYQRKENKDIEIIVKNY